MALPNNRERIVNRIMMVAGVLNTVLALVLCPRFQHIGMAWGVLISEFFVCACMVSAVLLDPASKYLFHGSVLPSGVST